MPVLVSLLDDCMLDGVRVAAATAVSMMCCTDGPCQDALRFADGLPLLVRMANSVNMKVAKVRRCLLSVSVPRGADVWRRPGLFSLIPCK